MEFSYDKKNKVFVYRSPINSLGQLDKFNEATYFDKNYEDSVILFFDNLRANEGLLVASPTLYNEYINLKTNKLKSTKKKESAILSLYKYILRMHSKCTPFGLFSGIGVGKIGDLESRILPLLVDNDSKIRLDNQFLSTWCEMISNDQRIKSQLKFYINHTCFISESSLRYYEYDVLNFRRKYFLSKIQLSEEILFILNICQRGMILTDIINKVVEKFGVGYQEVGVFIDELISNKVLISDLFPSIIGIPYLDRVTDIMNQIDFNNKHSVRLRKVSKILKSSDSISQKINLIKLKTGLSTPNIIQCDLISNSNESNLNEKFVDALMININKIAPFLLKEKDFSSIDIFKRKFLKKFGNEEVPLNIAIDKYLGVDFGALVTDIDSLLIDGITYYNSSRKGDDSVTLTDFGKLLLRKLTSQNNGTSNTIDITDADLLSLKIKEGVVAGSCFLFGSVIVENQKEKFVFDSIEGPSSTRLFARSSYGNPDLTNTIRSLHEIEEESAPDSIFADLNYIGQDKTGNVLARPNLRSFEIPIIGTSCNENIIDLNDLLVCVSDNKLIVKSKRLGKRVIPRESSAFSPGHNNIPAYVFLTYIQLQEARHSIRFELPSIFDGLSFIPRITYKNIILSLAKWKITSDQISNTIEKSTEKTLRDILKTKFCLPQRVQFNDGEGILTLDIDSPLSLMIIADTIKKRREIIFEEEPFLNSYNNKTTPVFKNEIIIPLTNFSRKNVFQIADKKNFVLNYKNKIYQPGDQYLYFKFFLKEADSISFLKDLIHPWMTYLLKEKLIEGFFFVKYHDNLHHIRLRIINRIMPSHLFQSLDFLQKNIKSFKSNNILTNYCIEPYEQENSNYQNNIFVAESLFCVDSQFVLNLLYQKDELLKNELLLVNIFIYSITQIFSLFQIQTDRALEIIKELSDAFLTEFGNTRELRLRIYSKFREVKPFINSTELPVDIELLFKKRFFDMQVILKNFAPNNSMDSEYLVKRLIHLFINRLTVDHPRKYEVVLYFITNKYYIGLKQQGLPIL